MKFRALIIVSMLLVPTTASADVEVIPTRLRDYQLPVDFTVQTSSVAPGPNGSTILFNTVGDAASARCSVIIADAEGAREFRYQYDESPTACSAVVAHPGGGFFARVVDPNARDGDITGATVFIDETGDEVWKIPDRQLVEGRAQPQGPGEFLGTYVTTIQPLVYSSAIDRLLGFSIGKITIGFDEKFLGQSFVANGENGFLARNGLTFGQAGVGFPADGLVKEDGDFLIRYLLNGQQGAAFFNFDGRNNISFFEPGDDDWSQRWVWRMLSGDRTVHIVWSETENLNDSTILTVTNEAGDVFFEVEYESFYQFRDGETLSVGLPINMWLTDEFSVIGYSVEDFIYLRFVDQNGESPGMARLDGITPNPPLGLVEGPEGLRLLAYDFIDNRIVEHRLEFEDVPEFDPDAGFGDVGTGIDLGTDQLVDVLSEVGCGCRTIAGRGASQPMVGLLLAALTALIWRRRKDA